MEAFNEDSVVHEPSTETFYISFKSGAKAFINYKVEKNDTIDLWHTEVPDEGRGKGIGGFLASKSIKDLASANSSKTVILSCSYLQHYYKKNEAKFVDFENIKMA